MACSCKTKNNPTISKEDTSLTKPFEVCPFCAFKHLSSVQIVRHFNPKLAIIELYLAYLHLFQRYEDVSKQLSTLIVNSFSHSFAESLFNTILSAVHQLAIDSRDQDLDNTPIHHTNYMTLNKAQTAFLLVGAANELYNFEVGYKDVNTSYVMGLLLQATRHLPEDLALQCRAIWKLIEEDKDTVPAFEKLIDTLYQRAISNLTS